MAPYQDDKFLKHYQVKLGSFEPERLNGRVLPNPQLKFGNNQNVHHLNMHCILNTVGTRFN